MRFGFLILALIALTGGGTLVLVPRLLPQTTPHVRCPVTPAHPTDSSTWPRAIGDGPVTIVDGETHGILPISSVAGSSWEAGLVIWQLAPQAGDRVVIEGSRWEGKGAMQFSGPSPGEPDTAHRSRSLTLQPIVPWQTFTALTWVQGPGCYVYHIRGDGVSEQIVFQANAQHP